MKTIWAATSIVFALARLHAQSTFVYDQQSSTESLRGESLGQIQGQAPLGQSFTPSLSAVGFIRLDLLDFNINNGKGATIYVNIRSTSITGPVLGSSIPVFMPDSFGSGASFTNFFFDTPVPVTPGTVYYFDLAAEPGSDEWAVRRFVQGTDYTGGTEYINGAPGLDDLWFREGIVVPEPSSIAFLLFGAGFLFWRKVRIGGAK